MEETRSLAGSQGPSSEETAEERGREGEREERGGKTERQEVRDGSKEV